MIRTPEDLQAYAIARAVERRRMELAPVRAEIADLLDAMSWHRARRSCELLSVVRCARTASGGWASGTRFACSKPFEKDRKDKPRSSIGGTSRDRRQRNETGVLGLDAVGTVPTNDH